MTPQQRKALEVYCREMADQLNEAGYDQKAVLELFARVDVPNTQESVKNLFRSIGTILYPETMGDAPSTTKLSNTQTQETYEVVNRAFAVKCGVSLEWPSQNPPLLSEDVR